MRELRGNAEVNERGEMGDFLEIERHQKGTRTAPAGPRTPKAASNSLKTNGAVVAELADAPA